MKYKYKQRLISLVLLLMLIPQVVLASFSDIETDSAYYSAVMEMSKNGIIEGTEQDQFSPDLELTRSMFVTMLGRALDIKPDSNNSIVFTDIPSDAYYVDYLTWASSCGLIVGTGDNYFEPESILTREQLATLMLRAYNYINQADDPKIELSYPDFYLVSDWAVDGLMYCTTKFNFLDQSKDFLPQNSVLRYESAIVLETFFRDLLDGLYSTAVEDAKTIEDDELFPVTAIKSGSDMVTWNETNDKILMVTRNRYPDFYQTGKTIKLTEGEIWTFTDKEILNWYKDNGDGVKNWDLRLAQLIGVPYPKHTHTTAFWVSPSDLYRPAYTWDITLSEMKTQHSPDDSEDYLKWFEANAKYSYIDSWYPWTRIGYTYDWADNGVEFGLSEFIVREDSEVIVEFTYTTDEFVEWLKDNVQ